MAYGIPLNRQASSGLGAKLCITYFDSTQTSSLTNVTVTGQTSGKTDTATYNSTLDCFVTWVNVYDTYTVSGVLSGETYTTDVVVNKSQKINVALPPAVSTILNDNSWEAIRYAADNSLGASYWAIGDAKQITLNGTVGIASYNTFSVWVYILGFNHNASVEGNNLIHFGGFRDEQNYSSTSGFVLNDNQYNNSVTSTYAFHMNSSNNNAGGWESSLMRTSIINANAESPLAGSENSFLTVLPTDLLSVLKKCTKYTDNVGGGNGNVQSNVTATQDWVFLLTETEVNGSTNSSNTYEANYQERYQYYINGNTPIMYRQDGSVIGMYYFLRSPYRSNNTQFGAFSGTGNTTTQLASYSQGFAPAFCV